MSGRPPLLSLAAVTLLITLPLACGDPRESAPRRESAQMTAAAPPVAASVGRASDVGAVVEPAAPRAFALAAETEASPEASAEEPDVPTPNATLPTSAQAIDSSGTGAAPQAGSSIAPAMIIRNGGASLQVDSLEPAVARVRQLAQRVGGYVANTSLQSGSNQVHSATIELKIPAARYAEAVTGLQPLGRVESVTETTEDVGEEFVDVTARMNNARRLEARLVDLLATRTGKLQDVLGVERELARVREQIERYEGRARFLRTRAAISTLSVTLHEPMPVIARTEEGRSPITSAFRQAWQNFVGFVAITIAALGVLVPIGLIAVAAWWGVRRATARGVVK